jgi:small redox-active disulfide protein 2
MKKIEILGTGCAKCQSLEQNTREAAEQLGIDAEIVKVTGMEDIIARGVMMTPALAIDGEVMASGKKLSVADIASLLASTPAPQGEG